MIDTNILRAVILILVSPVVIANSLLAEQLTRAADIPETHNPHPATQDSKLDKTADVWWVKRSAPNKNGLNLNQSNQSSISPFPNPTSEPQNPPLGPTAGSGLQPELSGLLNTDVRANDVISKDINTGVQVANLNPQKSPLTKGDLGGCVFSGGRFTTPFGPFSKGDFCIIYAM